jgi:hypothetical protein
MQALQGVKLSGTKDRGSGSLVSLMRVVAMSCPSFAQLGSEEQGI